jgi:hypothetical protein
MFEEEPNVWSQPSPAPSPLIFPPRPTQIIPDSPDSSRTTFEEAVETFQDADVTQPEDDDGDIGGFLSPKPSLKGKEVLTSPDPDVGGFSTPLELSDNLLDEGTKTVRLDDTEDGFGEDDGFGETVGEGGDDDFGDFGEFETEKEDIQVIQQTHVSSTWNGFRL